MTTNGASRQPIKEPIFLVSSERSGSTLFRLMLDHHPDIAFEHEFDFVVAMVSDDGELPSLEAYREYLATWRGLDYAVDPSLGYLELVDDFLRQKQAMSGSKPLVGATVHHNFDRLLHLWPDARFVHLLRDPRDVAPSVMQMGWAGNLYHATQWWTNAERCWSRLVAKLPPDRYVEVRYEELVAKPMEELSRVCEFLGVKYDPAMLEYSKTARQYSKPDPKLATLWKARLSTRQVSLVEAQTGDLLVQRGYEPAGAPKSIRPLQHELLMVESKVVRLRHKVREFGFGLVCLDVMGRHLHVGPVTSYAGRRIRAIQSERIAQEAAGLLAPSANMAPAIPRDSQPSVASRTQR